MIIGAKQSENKKGSFDAQTRAVLATAVAFATQKGPLDLFASNTVVSLSF